MTTYRSTREVARLLRLNPSRLARAVWDGRLHPPEKAPGGAFLWTPEDIERASWLLRRRDAKALWALVSKERKQQMTLEEFEEQVGLVPDAVLAAVGTLEVGAERRATVGVVVPVALEAGGRRIADEIVLYREDGDWKIHAVPLARMPELAR